MADLRLLTFAELPSTSAWLVANAGAHADESWVSAERQLGGHGRHGRAWVSPPGNLAASVLIRPRPGEGPPQQLSFVAALALADAVGPWTGRLRLWFKWPNDVMLHQGKLAGILLERVPEGIVAGFGVNVASAPAGLDTPVSALSDAVATPPPASAILGDLRPALSKWRERWRMGGFAGIRLAWLSRATPVGWRTQVRIGGETLAGTFAGLAEDGAMLLQRDGRTQAIHAGDVFGL